MKKFLSLVLAMIMTLSLVTISAGATEYKDLTDKDEIKYEEAVAVLNRIGVITGYDDGTFRPETELTRGAAAKIIVSLMIGPDAANALPNTSSPYPDVPASHTFAGVISYCKTAKYISGYGDGTFKPAGTLTGYAFAKMLLGALGYSSEVEGFTGLGWTNNVAKIGNVAGLFDRISFDGAAAVTRDQACQLALNTLKATLVTYGGTTMINGTTGTYTMQGTVATPKTSNNRDINANIGRKDWYGGNNQGSDYLTLEFGEEHFKDLRLEHDKYDPAHDQFGRPSNEWSYKKVTIGTFPLAADYTYTTQVAHKEDTDGTKEKALGLRNFDLVADGGYSVWKGWGNTGDVVAGEHGTTDLWLNGLEQDEYFVSTNTVKHKVADIADFTDNGTLVEVYVSAVDADWITDVVVIQTQLMNVKKIGSDYVSLERYEDPDAAKNGSPRGEANIGFNLAPIEVNVEQVKDSNEECYDILKGLKSGDDVAVIPVTTDDGKTYEAAEVYVPETVSGALTRVDTYGIGSSKNDERGAVSITVGGTAYKIADWNDEMWSLKTEDIKATRKDVTLLMDKYGNALLAKDVGATNDFMVIGNFYQALAGNKICTFVHGWDISGNEVDLNLGSSIKVRQHGDTQSVDNHVLGELVYYTSEGANGDADYVLRHVSAKGDKLVRDVYTNLMKTGNEGKSVSDVQADYEIKASNLLLPVVTTLTDAEIKAGEKDTDNTYGESKSDYGRLNTKENGCGLANHDGDGTYASTWDTTNHIDRYYDKGVKFIYVNYVEGDDEIESVEFKSGVQNVSQDELRQAIMSWPSQAAIKDDQVKAVVIKRESNDASVNRMLYVTKTLGFKEYDKDTNESFYEVEVAMFNSDGKFVTEQHIIVNKDLEIGDFATYTKVSGTKYEDNYYRVKQFTRHNTNPAVLRTNVVSNVLSTVDNKMVKHLVRLGYFSDAKFVSNAYTLYNGDKLVGDIGDDGSDAEMYKESYVLGGYRGSSTTVPASIERANGVIRTDKAEWLNATRDSKWDDIDSAEDLFDKIWNDGRTINGSIDVTKNSIILDDIELNILLNEKPDSDGFRTAYLVVISKIGSKAPSVTDDPLNTTYNRKDNYSTSYVNTMRKGDKFSMTILNKNLAVDVANLHGVVVIDRPTVNADYWVFEVTEGTIRIPLYSTVVAPDTYTVTVTVDGVKDEKLSQTGLKDGATYSEKYTVPTGKVATYEGKDYAAGTEIPLTATINKANVTLEITLKDAEPAPGTYSVKISVDGVELKNETGLANGAEVSVDYTVPDDKTLTYGGETFKAGEVVTIKVVVDGKDETIDLKTEDAVPPSANDVKWTALGKADGKVAIENLKTTKNDSDTELTVTGLPDDGTFEVVVISERKILSKTTANETIAYAKDAEVFVLKGQTKMETIPGTMISRPVTSFEQVEADLLGEKVDPAAANVQYEDAAASEIKVEFVGYRDMKIEGSEKTFTVAVVNVTVDGVEIKGAWMFKASEIDEFNETANKNLEADDDIGIDSFIASETTKGFVNVKDTDGSFKEVEVPVKVEEGSTYAVPQIDIQDDAQGNVTVTKKEGVDQEYKFGDDFVTDEPKPVAPDTKFEPTDEKPPVTVKVELAEANVNGFEVGHKFVASDFVVTGGTIKENGITPDTMAADTTSVAVTVTPSDGSADVTKDVAVKVAAKLYKITVIYLNATVMNGETPVESEVPFSVEEGTEVTLTIKAEDGYEIDTVTVDGIVAALTDGTLTLTADGPHSVTVNTKETVPAGQPFQITEGPETVQIGNRENTKKLTDLQKNVKWEIKETKLGLEWEVAVTGELNYITGFTGFGTPEAIQSGYYIDLGVDFTPGKDTIKTVTMTDVNSETSTTHTIYNKDGAAGTPETGEGSNKLTNDICFRIKDETSKAVKRVLEITTDTVKQYVTIDFSGVTLNKKQAMRVGAAETKATDVIFENDPSKITANDIQKDLTATIEGNEIILAGTLKPITKVWWDAESNKGFSSVAGEQTGYYAMFQADFSGATVTKVDCTNTTPGMGGVGVNLAETHPVANAEAAKTIDVLVRLADLEGKTGTLTYVVTAGTDTGVYTINTAKLIEDGKLKLDPLPAPTVEISKGETADGKFEGMGDSVKASDFQSGASAELVGGEVVVTGTLKPVYGWTTGWETADQNGYYVAFNVDASGVPGAYKLAIAGPKGNQGVTADGKNAGHLLVRIAETNGEPKEDRASVIRVLDKDGNTIAEWPINWSGAELEVVHPVKLGFSVSDVFSAWKALKSDNTKYYLTDDFQTLTSVKLGDTNEEGTATIVAKGESKLVKGWYGWNENDTDEQYGYYLAFNIDKNGPWDNSKNYVVLHTKSGVKAYSLSSESLDVCFRIADAEGTRIEQTVEIWEATNVSGNNAIEKGSSVTSNGKLVKSYVLDQEGVLLNSTVAVPTGVATSE